MIGELPTTIMPAHGLLTKTGVHVDKPRDASRLLGKSHYGTPLSNNRVQLDFIEAAFLLTEHKLIIHNSKGKNVSFQDLVCRAATQYPSFDSMFLIYRDLRKRGYIIRRYTTHNNITFSHELKNKEDLTRFISVFTEHDMFSLKNTCDLITYTPKERTALWYGIVDEEGDLTYYDISLFTPKGIVTPGKYGKSSAVVVDDRAIVFDTYLIKKLHDTEFYGKPFGSGLQLSIIEVLYLADQQVVQLLSPDATKLSKAQVVKKYREIYPDLLQRLSVYKDLKQKGLIVKTGFKFGAHFRAYTQQPDKSHAEYLVHVVPSSYEQRWAEISRAIRLAHSVNKEILFAQVTKTSVEYIKLGRLRP